MYTRNKSTQQILVDLEATGVECHNEIMSISITDIDRNTLFQWKLNSLSVIKIKRYHNYYWL